MNPFEDNAQSFDEKLTEIEPGVYIEHLTANELSDSPIEALEVPNMVFGSLEWKNDVSERNGVTDDVLSCYLTCNALLTGIPDVQLDIEDNLIISGLYDEKCGMSREDVESCFMHLGELENTLVYVECEELTGLNELCVCLENGDIVICYVSSAIMENESFADIPGVNADRFVQVIGVDLSEETEQVFVYYGVCQGDVTKTVPLDRFLKAWSVNSFYTITAKARDNNDY